MEENDFQADSEENEFFTHMDIHPMFSCMFPEVNDSVCSTTGIQSKSDREGEQCVGTCVNDTEAGPDITKCLREHEQAIAEISQTANYCCAQLQFVQDAVVAWHERGLNFKKLLEKSEMGMRSEFRQEMNRCFERFSFQRETDSNLVLTVEATCTTLAHRIHAMDQKLSELERDCHAVATAPVDLDVLLEKIASHQQALGERKPVFQNGEKISSREGKTGLKSAMPLAELEFQESNFPIPSRVNSVICRGRVQETSSVRPTGDTSSRSFTSSISSTPVLSGRPLVECG